MTTFRHYKPTFVMKVFSVTGSLRLMDGVERGT